MFTTAFGLIVAVPDMAVHSSWPAADRFHDLLEARMVAFIKALNGRD